VLIMKGLAFCALVTASGFLDTQRVSYAESSDASALSTPDIAERAKMFTVHVTCVQ
jgi:hypothetical protein